MTIRTRRRPTAPDASLVKRFCKGSHGAMFANFLAVTVMLSGAIFIVRSIESAPITAKVVVFGACLAGVGRGVEAVLNLPD